MTYTTIGPVRGTCGHKHRTAGSAARCVLRDQRDCRQVRGYSDREVVRTDGEPLTHDEQARVWDIMDRGA